MSSVLESPAKDQVQWLAAAGDDVVDQFLAIAQESLVRTLDRKAYSAAAKKLGLPAEQVEQTVEALGYLLTCIAGGTVSESTLPFGAKLKEAAGISQEKLREMISASSLQDPLGTSFVDLDWRLDVTVSSRSNPELLTPRILLLLTTRTGSTERQHLIQCDYSNFKHLYSELTRAMESSLSVLAKKTEKFLEHSRYV